MKPRTSGRTKARLDILLWVPEIPRSDEELNAFVAVGVLDKYLAGVQAPKLNVVVHVPEHLQHAARALVSLVTKPVGAVQLNSPTDYARVIAETDADIVVASESETLPASDTLLVVTEPSQMLREIELFVRGFDVPYSFGPGFPVWGMPWTNFYLMSELTIFGPLIRFHGAIDKRGPPEAAEICSEPGI